jgi:hypothetical protein
MNNNMNNMNNINNNNNKNTRITYKDNIKILKYYNIDIPKSRKAIKKKTDEILSSKLCRCIKKLGTDYESRSIGICTRTIFNSKKLKRGSFKCTGKNPTLKFRKLNKIKTKKNKK